MKKLQILLAAGFTMMAVNGFAQHVDHAKTTGINSGQFEIASMTTEANIHLSDNTKAIKAEDLVNYPTLTDMVSLLSHRALRQPLATMPIQGKDQPLRTSDNRLQQGVSTDSYNQVK